MIDNGDGYAIVLSEGRHKARKSHRCDECHREILPGETYLRETTVFEHRRSGHKTCAHCQVARAWLWEECGGFVWGSVEEDLREHATEGWYHMDVIRLAIGMQWMWRTPSGRLLPVPRPPLTSYEREMARRAAEVESKGDA